MAEAEAGVPKGQVRLERIYLKDASFESPTSPEVFGETWKPEIKVDINTKANPVADNLFEVVLSVTVRASRENDKTGFIVEVMQAGLFVIEGVPDEVRQQALGTICPATLFPYLREGIDNLVVKGGFPALQLAPVNFEALYANAMAQRQAEQQQLSKELDQDSSDEVTH